MVLQQQQLGDHSHGHLHQADENAQGPADTPGQPAAGQVQSRHRQQRQADKGIHQ